MGPLYAQQKLGSLDIFLSHRHSVEDTDCLSITYLGNKSMGG